MKRIIASLILCACFIATFSQSISISGVVYDKSGNVIPYVNIGVKEQKIGTVSNKEGYFNIRIPDSLRNKALTFSSVGFEDKNITVSSFEKNTETKVTLNDHIIELSQVMISNKKRKISKIGITGRTPFVVIPAESYNNNDILEQARLIEIRNPSRILDANVYLENGLSDSVNIRLNFYSIENGLPGKRIIEKSIVRKFLIKKGWLSFNLANDGIYVDTDFIVSFEYLPNESDVKKKNRLWFGAKAGSKDSFLRRGSQEEWHKNQLGGTTIYVNVES